MMRVRLMSGAELMAGINRIPLRQAMPEPMGEVGSGEFLTVTDDQALERDKAVLRTSLEGVTFKEMSDTDCEGVIRTALGKCDSPELRRYDPATLVGFVAEYL
jgi:hypothetical protein